MNPYLSQFNLGYIEKLLEQYQDKPELLEPTWRFFFDGMAFGENGHNGADAAALTTEHLEFELKVLHLIQAYRGLAYLIADVNPLDRRPKQHPLLDLARFGLKAVDLDRVSYVGKIMGLNEATVKDIIAALRTYYCSPATIEIDHIDDPKSREWLQRRVEAKCLSRPLGIDYKKRAHFKLAEAESFCQFLHKKFVGQKRFSLEGLDVLIPMLDFLIDKSTSLGADEIIIGMAHRGRLNVLANIFEKDIKSIFAEFSGNVDAEANSGDGDVKYHMGFSLDTNSFGGKPVHLSLTPNPSHLEAVNTVVMGTVRSKQKVKGDHERTRTWPVLLHGDAAFSGQGIIYEMLNMSELSGYTVGGTIHIITNNQVGFTTEPKDGRSTNNATDVAKMLQIPILRVNADEPEAVLRCMELACEFRQEFKRDVVIDVVGYRRFGHNEGDEPGFTQPGMYGKINKHPTVYEIYTEKLKREAVLTDADVSGGEEKLALKYETALTESKQKKVSPKMHAFGKRWTKFTGVPMDEAIFNPVATWVDKTSLEKIGRELCSTPKDFMLHPKIARLLADRLDMVNGKRGFDWGMGEALAFGSLLTAGHSVRIAGQDVKRGTFSHRHAVFFDVNTDTEYVALNNLSQAVADIELVNSLLSEYGALGFEFGQSLANPNKLSLWEAQFGDFVNGTQIIIDQFITSSAVKWQRFSGLVLLLPHGYEGQGPEHSSARIERFLQAAAQHNIQVCNLTTPAQFFHALRRQVLRDYRLPLIVATPKSLLRNPLAVSSYDDFATVGFKEIIDDANSALKSSKRVVMCSGKVYYDLVVQREKLKLDVAIVRLEQFYPFPQKQLVTLLGQYKNMTELVWCQEEPENMGGWWFMQHALLPLIDNSIKLSYAGRLPQASPAHGYMHLHTEQQLQIATKALTGEK